MHGRALIRINHMEPLIVLKDTSLMRTLFFCWSSSVHNREVPLYMGNGQYTMQLLRPILIRMYVHTYLGAGYERQSGKARLLG